MELRIWKGVFLRLAGRRINAFEIFFDEDMQSVFGAGALKRVDSHLIGRGPLMNHIGWHTNQQALVRKARGHNGHVRRGTKRVGEALLEAVSNISMDELTKWAGNKLLTESLSILTKVMNIEVECPFGLTVRFPISTSVPGGKHGLL